jgi:hypothetical protein
MTDPPSHPDTGISDRTGAHPGNGPATRRSRRAAALWIIAIAALLALMLVLHLTGAFGPGTHG